MVKSMPATMPLITIFLSRSSKSARAVIISGPLRGFEGLFCQRRFFRHSTGMSYLKGQPLQGFREFRGYRQGCAVNRNRLDAYSTLRSDYQATSRWLSRLFLHAPNDNRDRV